MNHPGKLTPDEITHRLEEQPDWEMKDDKLHREFKFDDFVAAFSFMTGVAILAEKMDHHPEWSNVYNRVTIDLCTHDADGITDLDFTLARAVDGML